MLFIGGGVWHFFFTDLYVHEIPTKHPEEKKLELTTHIREKTLDPQNIQKKKFGLTKYPCEKNIGPNKCAREKILGQQKPHEKKFWTHKISTRKNFGPTK